MNLDFTSEDQAFQKQVRAWMEENFTEDMRAENRKHTTHLPKPMQIDWQKRLYDGGFAGLNWPVEYGGQGYTVTQKFIIRSEMARLGAPQPVAFGITMVAPVIMKFGTDEQKQKYLPDILQSNVWWCQGYSEPGSGSDLASLSTKAVDMGDHYLVNGAKTWTTLAQRADMIFCLVRTSQEAKRQDGISFLLIDMHSPGIEVKPIVLIDGVQAPDHEVNTVFFTDVKVPKENLIGEEGKGWTCAKYLLEFERGNEYSPSLKVSLNNLRQVAKGCTDGNGNPLSEDANFAASLASAEMQITAMEATELSILGSLSTGQNVGPESSILKTRGTEIATWLQELLVQVSAYQAMPAAEPWVPTNTPSPVPEYAALAAPSYFNGRKMPIYAGSNEIQRNIMAKMVLGL